MPPAIVRFGSHAFASTTASPSSPTSSWPATRRAPSASSSRGSSGAIRIRCCSASPDPGKTFTMAQTIARVNRPTLVMVHNKTLAAQLYPGVPALLSRATPSSTSSATTTTTSRKPTCPATDSYIEKEATINDEIDRMRLSATRSLFERRDVIIVASVSCIYGLGSPEAVLRHAAAARARAAHRPRAGAAQARRNPVRAQRPRLRRAARSASAATSSRSIPSYEEQGLRIELFGDEVDGLTSFDPLTGKTLRRHDKIAVYPEVALRGAARADEEGRRDRSRRSWRGTAAKLESEGKLLEAQRLHQRTMFDLEMIREIGYCHGIENYARHLTGRAPGEPPPTLLDYLPAGRADHRRREPPDRAAGPRDVSRRPVAQGGAGRVRVPAAVGARQPAAEFRGVGDSASAQVVFVSATPGPVRAGEVAGRGRRADHPADRADRSADRRAAGQGPGGRPAAGDSRRASRGASGCW